MPDRSRKWWSRASTSVQVNWRASSPATKVSRSAPEWVASGRASRADTLRLAELCDRLGPGSKA